ncbi:MAG: carboxymuconolactone decarboxylase family protein [Woeseiaceae bacterium]
MPFLSFLPDDADMREIIRNRPIQMALFNQLTHDLMRHQSAFTVGERELIGAFVSSTNDCPYCAGLHSVIASHFDVPESTLEALALDFEIAPVEQRMRPVLRYVEKLTKTPYQMTQADADAVYAAGWDDSALSDAVLICGLFNMANRIIEGHGIDRATPTEKLAASGRWLAKFGYVSTVGSAAPQQG